MKIHLSKAIAKAAAKNMALNPPPIPLYPTKGKKRRDKEGRKTSEDEDDATNYVAFDIRLIPGDETSEKLRRKLKIFDDGTPEDWCKWRRDLEGLTAMPAYAKSSAQVSIINTLLRGKAQDTFVRQWTEHKNVNVPADNAPVRERNKHAKHAIQNALNDVALTVFGMTGALSAQKENMRKYYLFDPQRFTVREYADVSKKSISIYSIFRWMTLPKTRHLRPFRWTSSRIFSIRASRTSGKGACALCQEVITSRS